MVVLEAIGADAVAVTLDNRPDPVDVVGQLGVDAELVAFAAAIAEAGDAKDRPRLVELRRVPDMMRLSEAAYLET